MNKSCINPDGGGQLEDQRSSAIFLPTKGRKIEDMSQPEGVEVVFRLDSNTGKSIDGKVGQVHMRSALA